ncbi:MAG TPA: peptidoglycan editing factor PgeF [Gammaproteobacteria bacterium]|nr:peptidoglycan editing factor PgeF [Gammaproteobacteria bacterium]
MMIPNNWIKPDWPAPLNIQAFTTTRNLTVHDKVLDFNLGLHATQYPASVKSNRALLDKIVGNPIHWLNQIHSAEIAQLPNADAVLNADGAFSITKNTICAVMSADCMPVLICDTSGFLVCALHCGWRGFAQNIIQNAVKKIRIHTNNPLMAWLGPAIGVKFYEVGEEIRELFVKYFFESGVAFTSHAVPGKYWLDLTQLAKLLLHREGIESIFEEAYCTYQNAQDFYSARRDKNTGRFATVIWKTE